MVNVRKSFTLVIFPFKWIDHEEANCGENTTNHMFKLIGTKIVFMSSLGSRINNKPPRNAENKASDNTCYKVWEVWEKT